MGILFEGIAVDGSVKFINRAVTNSDGRAPGLVPEGYAIAAGTYKMTFATSDYFEKIGGVCFYPKVEVTFELSSTSEHFHVPLLISPFGYSTYRGS